ncbi:MAG: deoxyhypusine synthase family protein [Candidatus Omnitrophota bacterium]|jgi:deoxyhypusine synthase
MSKANGIKQFLRTHYLHFNAASVVDAAEGYVRHLKKGGKMLVAMAGAMSTGEIGLSLAEMIRQGKVDAVSTTGANLEEDIFNLVAHRHYKRIPGYRTLSAADETALYRRQLNRVTDTCIPEEEAMRRIEHLVLGLWQKAEREGQSYFPYQFMYQLVRSGKLDKYHQIDPAHSWVVAACKRNIPIYTPGWEDSTLGNIFVSNIRKGNLKSTAAVRCGLSQMDNLIDWYLGQTRKTSLGFFQIGGGIAGDFAICVVPLIEQDLRKKCRKWGYFAQISDSTTSYGSYSGAHPNEKITWGKLDAKTPKFIIESDASIVAPLIFQYVLES